MGDVSQALDVYVKLLIESERIMVRGSIEMLKAILALATRCYLAKEQKKDLKGGERKIWQMLKTGSKVEATTLTEDQVKLLEKNAKKYNIQFGETDNLFNVIKDRINGVDSETNLKTVFVRSSDWTQFEQFCKDFNITAVSHGSVEGDIKKNPSPETVIDDFEKNKKMYMNNNEEFDVGSWTDEWIKGGGDLDSGLYEKTLEKLEDYLLQSGISINAESMEQKIGMNPFLSDPAQDPIKKHSEKEQEHSTTHQKSQNIKHKEAPAQENKKEEKKKNTLDSDREAPDELDNPGELETFNDIGKIVATGTNEDMLHEGELKNYASAISNFKNLDNEEDPTDEDLMLDAETQNLKISQAPSMFD